MSRYESKGYLVFKYIVFALMSIFLAFPLYWIVSIAFRTEGEILSSTVSVLPKTFTIRHFVKLIEKADILNSLANSLIITISTVIVSVLTGLFIAYILARYVFKGRDFFRNMFLFTQFIPMIAYIIPLYLVMSKLQLLNTRFSLCVTYVGVALPVGVVMLIHYIKDVPISLEEAARIDGCTKFQLMTKIAFPLSIPGIVSTAIYIFITVWQEYLVAVSFISRKEAYTVSLALTRFQDSHGTDWGGIMAGGVFISIPTLLLFMCFRKLFTNSLTGGVKG